MFGRSTVAEDSVSFDEDLIDVDHQSSSVSESHALLDPLNHCIPVLLVIAGSAQIARTEDVGLLLDDKVIMRDDPGVINGCQLLHLIDF